MSDSKDFVDQEIFAQEVREAKSISPGIKKSR